MPVQTILVAFDDPSSETLARAADYAEQLGSTLIVTNVAPPKDANPSDADRAAQERLEQARGYLESRGLQADLVATKGQPADAIIRLAQERNVDLIVVGSRHKRFFERLVEGSVNQNVLRRAGCDVLVVY
ncbi:MAG TPA: universal stress protein [Gaiellaceae bacterium]|nr:universal stress protein [Gaiellaceae bacterium]